MPVPKISGNLFNCAFNCALPTLLEKITLLAQLEVAHNLPSEDDPVYISYNKLKTLFASHYKLHNSEETEEEEYDFTWSTFNKFLLIFPFSAQEMIFAPVFRLFIAESASLLPTPSWCSLLENPDHDHLNPDHLALQHDMDPSTGRYLQLEIPVMEQGFYQKFGIKIVLLSWDTLQGDYVSNPLHLLDTSYQPPADSPLSKQDELSLYLRNEHYELQPHNLVDQKKYLAEASLLVEPFQGVLELTKGHMTPVKTHVALVHVADYIKDALAQALLRFAHNVDQYTARHGSDFDPQNPEEKLTYSLILLIIGAAEADEPRCLYSEYLDYMTQFPSYSMKDANQLADLIIDYKCNLEQLNLNPTMIEMKRSYSEHLQKMSDTILPTVPLAEDVKSGNESESEYEYNLTSNFQFNCMIGLLAAGAILLCVAIFVAFPPTLAAVPVAFGIAGSISLLASAGVFAYRQCYKKPATDLSSVGKDIGLV